MVNQFFTMKKFFSFFLFGLCTLSMSGESIEQRLLSLNDGRISYIADFEERIIMPRMNKQTIKRGKMYYAYTESLLMSYSDPAGDYSLIRDGSFVAMRKGKRNTFSMSSKKGQMYELRETLLGSLSGDLQRVALVNGASISCEEKGDSYVCTLVKTDKPSSGVYRLEAEYERTTGLLTVLRMIQVNGNYTEYVTSKRQTNVSISDDIWKP